MPSALVAPERDRVERLVRFLDIAAKAILVLMLVGVVTDPELGNMQDKAAWWRAVTYPMLAFTLPLLWLLYWRDRSPFPWLADLCITVPCFSDILGNRLDLYDRIWWFDDWMHFFNTGLLAAAVVVLTLDRAASRVAVVERSLAAGLTAALVWEVAEYFAFLHRWEVLPNRLYEDTLGDLVLGATGSVVAGLLVHRAWRRGRLERVPLVVRVS